MSYQQPMPDYGYIEESELSNIVLAKMLTVLAPLPVVKETLYLLNLREEKTSRGLVRSVKADLNTTMCPFSSGTLLVGNFRLKQLRDNLYVTSRGNMTREQFHAAVLDILTNQAAYDAFKASC